MNPNFWRSLMLPLPKNPFLLSMQLYMLAPHVEYLYPCFHGEGLQKSIASGSGVWLCTSNMPPLPKNPFLSISAAAHTNTSIYL